MSETWDTDPERLTGDVRLDGYRETVGLSDVEDVFVHGGAVDGELAVADGEYVFTDVPTSDDSASDERSVETAIAGEEDGYVRDAENVVLRNVEDVFVHNDGANTLTADGAEQVFRDGDATPTKPPEEYEVTVSGWDHTREARDPRDGVAVLGARNEVTLTQVSHDATVYVVGYENEVTVEGKRADVTVFFVGRDNTVTVGPFCSATTAAESGFDNQVNREPVPPSAVIQTNKEQAHADATFGRHRLTWQEPVSGKDWCPNCGADADAVIRRRQRDAFFLFGTPIRTYDDGGESFECEECSTHVGSVSLSEDERRDALQ